MVVVALLSADKAYSLLPASFQIPRFLSHSISASLNSMNSGQVRTLLHLPSEVLTSLLWYLTTPSFLEVVVTCHKFFDLASSNRELVLAHLQCVPGIKLGLEDHRDAQELFRVLRQRASASLYGANFHADCRDLRFDKYALVPSASCLADSTDQINMSLVVRGDLTVRHYGGRSDLKQCTYPFNAGLGKVLQVVHWSSTISILYRRVTTATSKRFCFVNASLSKIDQQEPTYLLAHYSAYTNDQPDVFQLPSPQTTRDGVDVEPIYLAVHNRLKCAIVWKTRAGGQFEMENRGIFLYTADRVPAPGNEGDYKIIPLYDFSIGITRAEDKLPPDHDKTLHMDNNPASAISFIEHGRRLKLYTAGRVTPHSILGCDPTDEGQFDTFRPSSIIDVMFIKDCLFDLEHPFYGQHTFNMNNGTLELGDCFITYLRLAVLSDSLIGESSSTWLYIIQDCMLSDPDECAHVLTLNNSDHCRHRSFKVVGRLWGWPASCASITSLTAMDSVCISPKGTRIAIACWNRILVWPLNPEVLCEDWPEDRIVRQTVPSSNISDAESDASDNGDYVAADNSSVHSNSSATSAAVEPQARPMIPATRFYDLVTYPGLGKIVELRPIVLKLPGGAIARKMMWKRINDHHEPVPHLDEPSPRRRKRRARLSSRSSSRARSLESDTDMDDHHKAGGSGDYYENQILSSDWGLTSSLSRNDRQKIIVIGKELEGLVAAAMKEQGDLVDLAAGNRLETIEEESEGSRCESVSVHILSSAEEQDDLLPPQTTEPLPQEPPPPGLSDDLPLEPFPIYDTDPETPLPPSSPPLMINGRPFRKPRHKDPANPANSKRSFPRAATLEPLRRPDSGTSSPVSWSPPRARCPSPASVADSVDSGDEPTNITRERRKTKRRSSRRRQYQPKRMREDELVVLTDRGVQMWYLGAWGTGKREEGVLQAEMGDDGDEREGSERDDEGEGFDGMGEGDDGGKWKGKGEVDDEGKGKGGGELKAKKETALFGDEITVGAGDAGEADAVVAATADAGATEADEN